MARSRKEITTLSSIKNRMERGMFDRVSFFCHSADMEDSDEYMSLDIDDPEDIPNTPETIEVRVKEYSTGYSAVFIRGASIFS